MATKSPSTTSAFAVLLLIASATPLRAVAQAPNVETEPVETAPGGGYVTLTNFVTEPVESIPAPEQPAGAIALPVGEGVPTALPEAWVKTPSHILVRNVSQPTLTPFLPSADKRTGTAVVIAPGGGGITVAIDPLESLRARPYPASPPAANPSCHSSGTRLSTDADRSALDTCRFGRFRLDLAGRRLTDESGAVLPLAGRAFDVLEYLVRHRDRVVDKDELLSAVWPHVIVEANNLTQAVSAIRRALGDSRETPEFVATIAGRGYRFVAVISKDGESEIAGTAAFTPPSPAPDRRHLIAGLGALGAAALFGTGAWLTWGPPGSQSDPADATAMPSLAVLPFVNMSNEAGNEPFADGLSEEVLNVLAGIQGLKVAGRTSSFYFKNKSEKPDVIAATLGVNHLLEGSVRWDGPRVRITTQLIDATTGFHLWSQSFDREIADVFAVQEEIARSVADALQVKLLPADEAHLAKRGTQSPEAHRLYLIARGKFRERGLANLRAAKALFEEAIKRDPLYANAYSGLADTYNLLIYNYLGELQDGEQLGRRAAERAVELDPTSSEAHASRANFAWLRYETHGDVQELERAIADYQRAIELDPSNAHALHWYGLAVQDRDPDGALSLFKRAVERDPLMRQAQLSMADVFHYRGQYDRARGYINDVIDRSPDFVDAYGRAGLLEWQKGHLVDARSWFSKAYEVAAEQIDAVYVYVISLDLGDRATAAEWVPRMAGNPYFEMVAEAGQFGIEGRYSQALEARTRGLEQGFDTEPLVMSVAHLALVVRQPERATASVLKRHPELAKDESPITFLNCDAALALAASWQRTNQRPAADRLLRRTAVWLDGPRAPRWPTRHIARAQVHALLGERDQAFDALDRAFDEGHRGALAGSLGDPGGRFKFLYRGEDNPLFDSIRSDPRFTAWFARIHADNARQLAKLKKEPGAGH